MKEKKYDFITIGGSTEDITVYTNEGVIIDNQKDVLKQKLIAFEFGAKLKVEHAYSTFGGGASNAAVCLSKLGLRVASLVSIGHDERGKRILVNFTENKVDTNLVKIRKNQVTGFSFLLVGQGNEHVVFSNRAANNSLDITAADLKELDQAKWVYMTSLSGQWRKVLDQVFKTKARVAWNPGHEQLHAGFKSIGKYLKKTAMLTVNKDEAIELVVSNPKYTHKDNAFLNDIENLLRVIKEYGPEIVVVTDGKNGAEAFDGKRFYRQGILKERKRMDTTGVGDAFGSTFTAGLEILGGDIKKSMYMAVKNVASVIGEQGAQNGLLTRRQILKTVKS